MDLENRIMKVVNDYLESDKIEETVNKAMDKAVQELFSRYGGLGDVIADTLKKQMTPVIEGHDYSEYTLKLEHVLTSVLEEHASDTNKLLQNFEGAVKPYPETIKISGIFDKYCEYISKNVSTDDLEIDYDDEPTYANVTCNGTFTEQERYLYSGKDESGLIEFNCEDDDSLDFSILINKYSWSNHYHIVKDFSADIKKIKYLNEFEVFVLGLSINNVGIILDESSITDEDVEVESRPEASFY